MKIYWILFNTQNYAKWNVCLRTPQCHCYFCNLKQLVNVWPVTMLCLNRIPMPELTMALPALYAPWKKKPSLTIPDNQAHLGRWVFFLWTPRRLVRLSWGTGITHTLQVLRSFGFISGFLCLRWFENHGVNPAKKDKPFATNFPLMSATWSLLRQKHP